MAPSDGFISDPFHTGEREAQARSGVRAAGAPIRRFMPAQHRAFFAGLRYLPFGVLDEDGAPRATMLFGPAGFVASPDPATLRIAAPVDPDDPVAAVLRDGAPVGILGIDLSTRRRNRANGTIAALDPAGITVAVTQSFGNCPQYIQARSLTDSAIRAPGGTRQLAGLDDAARLTIGAADIFFVASASGAGAEAAGAGGADMSHRGGRPGFVRVDGDTLTVPDFHGNRYFNTLGNILLEPRVALLFPDFASGDMLHVSGTAAIEWDSPDAAAFEGAERLWRVRVTQAWRRLGALPATWSPPAMAPTTARTGEWIVKEGDKPERGAPGSLARTLG